MLLQEVEEELTELHHLRTRRRSVAADRCFSSRQDRRSRRSGEWPHLRSATGRWKS